MSTEHRAVLFYGLPVESKALIAYAEAQDYEDYEALLEEHGFEAVSIGNGLRVGVATQSFSAHEQGVTYLSETEMTPPDGEEFNRLTAFLKNAGFDADKTGWHLATYWY